MTTLKIIIKTLKQMEKLLEKVETILIYVLVVFVPLAILPVFPDFFLTPKLVGLTFIVGLLLLIKLVKTFNRGSLSFTVGSFDFPLLILAGAYVASGILNSSNRMEAFFLPGTGTIMVSSILVYFFVNQLSDEIKRRIGFLLYIDGILVSLVSLLVAAGAFSAMSNLPAIFKLADFNTLGGSLAVLVFLVTIIPFGIDMMRSEKDLLYRALQGVSLSLVVFAIVISVLNITPGKPASPKLPSLNTSWVVMIDSLKADPLLGVGAGNYLTAFNQYRPFTYNSTDLWRVRFQTARNFYMTVATEAGLIGLSTLFILGYLIVKEVSKYSNKEMKLVGWTKNNRAHLSSLIILVIWLAIFPGNIVFVFLLTILLSLNSESVKINLGALGASLNSGSKSGNFAAKLPVIVVTLPVLIALCVFSFYGVKSVRAEYFFKKSMDSLAKDDGGGAYNFLVKAISESPYIDRYHTAYAQLNLALANSVASSKKEMSDEERATVTQLIQQAIREGKAGVTLNQQRAVNWETLARIYQAVMPLAEGADQFAVDSFRQAIALDPLNPDLRIALGGIFFAGKDYESASRIFELAVAAKPDYANAHYNFGFTLKELGKTEAALAEIKATLSLIEDKSSKDYELVTQVIKELEEKKKTEQVKTEQGESLSLPQQQSNNIITPPLDLPSDAEPPTTDSVPSPTPLP